MTCSRCSDAPTHRVHYGTVVELTCVDHRLLVAQEARDRGAGPVLVIPLPPDTL